MLRIAIVLTATLLLAACGSTPQAPISLDSNFIQNNKTGKLAVYMDEMPEVDTSLEGASCLLCYAAAAAANSSLSSHFQSLSAEDLAAVQDEIVTIFSEKNATVEKVSTKIDIDKLKKFKTKELNFAEKDFRGLKQQLQADQLLVIDFTQVGAARPYNGYIPLGPPSASIRGTVYIVDLDTNKLLQYYPLSVSISSQGEWDEAPSFPGLTNSYYEAIETAKDRIKQQFSL